MNIAEYLNKIAQDKPKGVRPWSYDKLYNTLQQHKRQGEGVGYRTSADEVLARTSNEAKVPGFITEYGHAGLYSPTKQKPDTFYGEPLLHDFDNLDAQLDKVKNTASDMYDLDEWSTSRYPDKRSAIPGRLLAGLGLGGLAGAGLGAYASTLIPGYVSEPWAGATLLGGLLGGLGAMKGYSSGKHKDKENKLRVSEERAVARQDQEELRKLVPAVVHSKYERGLYDLEGGNDSSYVGRTAIGRIPTEWLSGKLGNRLVPTLQAKDKPEVLDRIFELAKKHTEGDRNYRLKHLPMTAAYNS